MTGHYHLDLRKRLYKKLEMYPHPEAFKRFLDRIMVFVAIAGPIAMLPQVYQAFASQDTKGLSVITWVVWTFISVIWFIYGLVHKEIPILVSQGIYFVLHICILMAIFLYS